MEVGQKFQALFVVDERVYQGFIQVFKDRNPLHTNAAYALSKGFTEKVMHGNILCGFLSYFIGECLPTKDVVIHSQEIQFTKAVYLNDQLELNAVIEDFFESVNAVAFKFNFKNQNQQIVAKGKVQIGLT
jgi:3-hydroxybutyryl-CoA dehydratase